MKVTLKNNSCSGVHRAYGKFVLELNGHATLRDLEVPDHLVPDMTSYLRRNHPAVEVTLPKLSAVSSSPAATTSDASVVDINIDDEEGGITIEQHLRNLGLLTDAAEVPVSVEAPAVTPAPAATPAPAKAPGKAKGGVANLKPAKSAKATADKPGGNK